MEGRASRLSSRAGTPGTPPAGLGSATAGVRRRENSMSLAKRNEAANVTSDINVTPMVDVMLVLLIIFMVVTPMLQHGVPVDMAKVNNPTDMHDADKEDALLVAVTRDDKVFFGTDPIKVDELKQKIKNNIANRT